MIKPHLQALAAMRRRPALLYKLRKYFQLSSKIPLYVALRRKNLGQADIVLALLKINTPASLHFAERLIGKPITRGPTCLFRYRVNGAPPRVLRQPRVTYVIAHNPHPRATAARLRFDHFRVGRTEQQLLIRGITRRDIRRAVRNDWIHMQ